MFKKSEKKKVNKNLLSFLFVASYINVLQAFSHFTFERSGHQLIVVDIQGVGDLYTDPQIHTVGSYCRFIFRFFFHTKIFSIIFYLGERHRIWRWKSWYERNGAIFSFTYL